jgi:hypothetical protein
LSCVLARQVWFAILQELHLQVFAPQLEDSSIEDWWHKVSRKVDVLVQKGLNSIIILVAWSLWNHQNCCVFNGVQPNLNELLFTIRNEMYMWGSAGARVISFLLTQVPPE